MHGYWDYPDLDLYQAEDAIYDQVPSLHLSNPNVSNELQRLRGI